MGEFLQKQYGSKMYSLGVFAGEGSYFGNFGTKEELSPPEADHLDIKHVIKLLNGKVNFINIPIKPEIGGQWLFNKIIINDTFIDLSGSNEMTLSKHFDGLLLIDKISPPEK